MNKKTRVAIKMALLPTIPLIGAAIKHISPDWITGEVFFISQFMAILSLVVSTVITMVEEE